jgi:hypothetical protein
VTGESVTALQAIRELFMPAMRWWGDTPVGAVIRQYSALIALTQTLHLLGLTMLAGTLLIVDLRLMDVGFVRQPPARIAEQVAPYTLAGLVILLITGPLILSSETLKAYESSFFWMKMSLLATALVFHFTVHRRVVHAEPTPPLLRRSLVGGLSLSLWLSVALAGKMMGIYGDDLRQEQDPFRARSDSSGAYGDCARFPQAGCMDGLRQTERLQKPYSEPAHVEFVPGETVARGSRMSVMIVVPAFAETQQRHKPVVP